MADKPAYLQEQIPPENSSFNSHNERRTDTLWQWSNYNYYESNFFRIVAVACQIITGDKTC